MVSLVGLRLGSAFVGLLLNDGWQPRLAGMSSVG